MLNPVERGVGVRGMGVKDVGVRGVSEETARGQEI